MSEVPTSVSGRVRVTVASGARRVDLLLPGSVPVAELVPELARSVGLLDATTVHAGYRLVTRDGRELAGGTGLTGQGVEDGGWLTVAAGVDEEPPRVYDDVVEAMADVVERDLRPWDLASARRTALVAAGLSMVLGAAALVAWASPAAAVTAAGVALALVTGGILLSRVQREADAAVAVAWMGAGYAAVAGFMLVPDDGLVLGLRSAGAGAGASVAGVVSLVGLGKRRTLAIPPVLVGAFFLATGLVVQARAFDPAVVLTAALAFVVMLGSIFPWLALAATNPTVEQPHSHRDPTVGPPEIDPVRLASDARVAHEILVAMSASVGLLLVLVAPLAVSLGVTGALLGLTCSAVVMLRTRQYRSGAEVLVGLVSGVLGLVSTAVSTLWLQPAWRPTAAVVLVVSGAVVVVVTLSASRPSVRRGRWGDVAESVSLFCLLPLLVLATGVLSAVRG